MSEEKALTSEEMEVLDSTVAMDVVQETMDKFLASASVEAVYGRPVKNGDNVIIPAAEVLSGLGFGVGSGGGRDEKSQGKGSGGGGGGRVFSRPVAVIVASPSEIRVEPVVDVTKIALAALTASGFMMGMLIKMMKGTRDQGSE